MGEAMVREERKQHFLSGEFHEEDAGSLFPSSWKMSFQIAKKDGGHLCERPEFLSQAAVLGPALASALPTFDKCTEDGIRFRIYRVGGIEVRTTQESGSEEEIGAVFSAPS